MPHRELFRVYGLPVLQNKMYDTETEAINCPKGDIVLVQDTETGLVYNSAFNQDLLVYDSSYQNEQSYSEVFQQHLRDVSRIIDRHFKGKTLIEIGCGKGYFLNYLQNHGYKITGLDPAYVGEDDNIIRSCFKSGLGIAAEGVILRHVLEHIQYPMEFLASITEANGNKGLIYIEVPCLDWIIQHRAWFDIHYEHVNYFRLSDLQRMFDTVLESGYLFGKQYLYIVAKLVDVCEPKVTKKDMVKLSPQKFFANIKECANLFEVGKQHVIWGGASKGVIFAFFMKQAGVRVDMVIDINSAKQEKYLAGSGLRIYSPAEAFNVLEAGANIFVMNPIYLNEIMAECGNREFKFQNV
jgi:SAM-dependent methyltransferase